MAGLSSGCRCPDPREGADPRLSGSCVKCGRTTTTAGISAEEIAQVRAFYDRLAVSAFPPNREPGKGFAPIVPRAYEEYRAEAERRHLEGLDTFGYAPDAWRNRDNMNEGRAEETDGGNYVAFDVFQFGGVDGDPEIALALEEAHFLYMAYRRNKERSAKRRGAP